MPFNGWPAKRSRNVSLQLTRKPQLEGRSGAISTPAPASVPAQLPSEPSLGQLAPPKASTVTSARGVIRPSALSKHGPPSSVQPTQRCRILNCTPIPLSCRNQTRKSGDAFIARGKTRPLEPMKVSCPSASHQARRSAGANASIAARRRGSSG